MGLVQSKIVKEWKHENQRPEPSVEVEIANPNGIEQPIENQEPYPARRRHFDLCVLLHKAALKGDWDAAAKLITEDSTLLKTHIAEVEKTLLLKDSTLLKTHIAEGEETLLHLAAAEGHAVFVDKLLDKMAASDLEIQNNKGNTALCFAAASGHVNIAEAMVLRNGNLPTVRGEKGITPLYMAVWKGHKEMADYLFGESDFKSWTEKDQIELLTASIHSGLYDLAVKIVEHCEKLAVAEDNNDQSPLEVLASKPFALRGTRRQGYWDSIASTIFSYMKLKASKTSAPSDAKELLDCLWEKVRCQEDVETAQFPGRNVTEALFIAARNGNDDFLVELIRRYPNFIYKVNQSNHSIFHIAVSHRYVKVFNLIYELCIIKDLMMLLIDKNGNNILHLAAILAPQCQLDSIPGAALQMQWEVLWYKEVEKIVHPSFRDMKNKAGQTPYQLFLKKHKNLMKEGEKQMKQIAKSCMLVTTLIATVVFTTAFTVPGGYNNNTGVPILHNNKLFMVFPISEAVATLASLISMLMFLSVLTSRYSDNDFLRTLPLWLVVGVAALFVSIVAMMVVFCSCLLFDEPGGVTMTVLLVFFASVPVMFIVLKYHLLVTIIHRTFSSTWLFRSNNRLS